MRLVLQVTDQVAAELRARAPRAASAALDGAARRLGVALLPQHPAGAGAGLASWFEVEVPDAAAAAARAELAAQPGVLAAFLKPPDAPP